MVRITLPNRLKPYTGTNSANQSRSNSPGPAMKNKHGGNGDNSPEFAKGLMLKIVVIKVRLLGDLQTVNGSFEKRQMLIVGGCRPEILQQRTRVVLLIQ